MSSIIEDMKDERVPSCLFWSVEDVANWIEQLGFPQYKECFVTNFVCGSKLVCVDASTLPNLGVHDFEHIKLIASKVRELLTVEDPYWNRSISLPPREEMGMYLESKSKTGDESQLSTLKSFHHGFEKMKWEPPLSNHCLILPSDDKTF